MKDLNSSQVSAIKIIFGKLAGYKYAIRGTASLVLHNLDMNVADIDIICDKETALRANELFAQYIVDPVSYKESPKFKSYFGKFKINDVDVEFMGEWQIKDKDGNWSEVFDGSSYEEIELEGQKIRVTKVADELRVFILMGRFNAYHKIKKQLPPVKDDKISGQEQTSPQIGLFS